MKKVLVISALALMLMPNVVALAQPPMNEGLIQFENETLLSNTDLTTVIGRIIRLVLSFLGLIAVVIIIIGGFQWMTSGGNEEKIGGAKKLMGAGIIGLFIIVIAYAASLFIMNAITRIVNTRSS